MLHGDTPISTQREQGIRGLHDFPGASSQAYDEAAVRRQRISDCTQLDMALQGFDQALRFWLPVVVAPPGSGVALVDLYSASLGRQGLVTIQRRLGIEGPGLFDFDIHPTNRGHAFFAGEFKKVWKSLP